jgi:hypothetical protein
MIVKKKNQGKRKDRRKEIGRERATDSKGRREK